ncbi:hypothetical protein RvY_09283 [Ramazzottius varieornatus]|uniref:Uncharacterized protein n=1 Tax=Ramazzottius varieornatus TaxID=947166 RepID=A0A1D1VGR2_RAMVA|nr:hypothetical protein RvY_09283 [Ramazzottius varieornatus]
MRSIHQLSEGTTSASAGNQEIRMSPSSRLSIHDPHAEQDLNSTSNHTDKQTFGRSTPHQNTIRPQHN